jgi:hypothetical protein
MNDRLCSADMATLKRLACLYWIEKSRIFVLRINPIASQKPWIIHCQSAIQENAQINAMQPREKQKFLIQVKQSVLA